MNDRKHFFGGRRCGGRSLGASRGGKFRTAVALMTELRSIFTKRKQGKPVRRVTNPQELRWLELSKSPEPGRGGTRATVR